MSAEPKRRMDHAIRQTRKHLAELEQIRDELGALADIAPDLVGLAEAAELLELSKIEFSRRRRNGRIPPPIADLASGPVWLRAQFTFPNTLKEEK